MSDASLDGKFYVSFGVIMSVQHADVETVRTAIQNCGGKIVFQTVSKDPLYLLRGRQVEQITQGDVSDLLVLLSRKTSRNRIVPSSAARNTQLDKSG
jgi:hypothetical protein